MDINTNVVKNYQTAEYGKFVELKGTEFPPVSVVRLSYPDTSSAFPANSGLKPLSSVDIYPKYAILTHIANPEDIKISLSAQNINVSLDQLELNTDVFNPGNITTHTTTALTSSLYVGEAFIFSIRGTSYAGYDQYLQIFDSGNANKIFSQIIKANENFYFEFPKGFYVENGTVRNSLTPVSHTPGNNDLIMTISTWV